MPERYPLMTRWVWDANANTGVIREVWHGDNVDHICPSTVPDSLRDISSCCARSCHSILTSNGIYRDGLWYVDLLFVADLWRLHLTRKAARYLRTDFSASEADPLEHVAPRHSALMAGQNDRARSRSRFKTLGIGGEGPDDRHRQVRLN